MKTTLLAATIATLCMGQAMACTTILVGNQATTDGSFIAARNEDYSANNAKHMVIHPAAHNQHGVFKSHGNDFTYPLPKEALSYTAIHDFDTQDKSMGEAGFNSAGVGMTATETIYNGQPALKADPYVEKTGITEDAIQTVVLPRIHSAREGVELLGKIIEQQGAGEGFGVAFVDQHDLWYLETGSGHQWMATRLPADKYFVSANQGRLRQYDPKDTANYLGSPTLISFAEQHGLYSPKDGAFDFHKAYSQDVDNDVTYNYPRVWTLQHMFNPQLKTTITDGKNFPVFLTPAKKISIADIEQALRNHYQGTAHDPMPTTTRKSLTARSPYSAPRSRTSCRCVRTYPKRSAKWSTSPSACPRSASMYPIIRASSTICRVMTRGAIRPAMTPSTGNSAHCKPWSCRITTPMRRTFNAPTISSSSRRPSVSRAWSKHT
ncbi:Dipeptidase [Edwardsiella tarda]|nr:Dipeptidase [Edwardsiella tarda]